MHDFKFLKLRGLIFTPEFSIGDKLFIANTLKNLSSDKFDGDLFNIPIPQNASLDIPRLILNSKDGTWMLEASLDRTSIAFLKPINLSVPVPDIIDFCIFVRNLFKAYMIKTKIKVNRLAFLTERYCEIKDISPAQFIANRYFKEKYLQNIFHQPDSLELHTLKKLDYKEFPINSWVRLKSSNLANEEKTPILILINDINTLSDLTVSYSESDIERFFDFIPKYIENITTLLF